MRILHGDSAAVMSAMPEGSVDSIVTDPPYGLEFMGKHWDRLGQAQQAWHEQWASDALRVLRPGGYLVAFGGTRTYHHLACALEAAGFEVVDLLQWLYGQGFPKSMDVSKAIDKAAGAKREVVGARISAFGDTENSETADGRNLWVKPSTHEVPLTGSPVTTEAEQWDGWGTALKPGYEPIVLARKPVSEVESS